MKYELARKLQAAQFPHKHKNSCMTEEPCIRLEELIEACGDKFDTLSKVWNARSQYTGKWNAGLYDGLDHMWFGPVGEGDTPIEAMADLYIKLYAKETQQEQ